MATKEEILDAISNMTVIELKELLDAFEEKFEVTAAAPVAVAARTAATAFATTRVALRMSLSAPRPRAASESCA